MPDYDDDDRRDERADRPPPPPRTNAAARVSAPGMLLIVAGLTGAIISGGLLAVAVTKPAALFDAYRDFVEQQPPGPQKADMQQKLPEMEQALRLDNPANMVQLAGGLVLNLLAVVGGIKMRSLSGYGLAMTGAVCGIIPVSGCCCLTMPVGIWAVVVLANADVKRAFDRNRRRPADDYDDFPQEPR